MRLPAVLLLLMIALGVPARAEENQHTRAGDVRKAYEAGDMRRLQALAADRRYDPWLVADSLCMSGAYDAALVYAKAVDRQDAARLPAYLAERRKIGHDKSARAAIRLASLVESGEDYEAALAVVDGARGGGDALERVLLEMSYANLLAGQKRYAEAGEVFIAGGRLAERIGWLPMAAEMYYHASRNSRIDGNLDGMLLAATHLLTVQQGRDDRAGIGDALILIGTARAELGDHGRALEFLEQADAIFAKLDDPKRRAWVLGNMGHVLSMRGEYGRATSVYTRGLEFARKARFPHRIAHILASLGTIHANLHDFDRALELQEEALEIFTERHDASGMAQCIGNMGHIYGSLHQYDKAVSHLQRALDVYKELGEERMVIIALVNQGDVRRKQGNHSGSKQALGEALALARKKHDDYLTVHALQSLADTLIPLGEFEGATKALDESQRLSARLASPRLQLEDNRLLAELWFARGDYARSVRAAKRAVEYTLSLLAGLGADQASVARESMGRLFTVSLDAAVAWGRQDAIFAAAETGRAGALLESLENRRAIRGEHVPDALRERELEVGLALKAAERAYQKAVAAGELSPIRRAKANLDKHYETRRTVFSRIRREARAAASVLYPVTVTLEEAQAGLGADEAFVTFSLLGKTAVAQVVMRKKAWTVRLGASEEIRRAADAHLDDTQRDVAPDVERLRKQLIEPLELPASVRRLLVVPDGVLGYVPFALLVGEQAVVFAPSATAYLALRDRAANRPKGEGVLALGDPDYRSPHAADGEVAERGGMHLVALPATREEATTVGTDTLLGAKATKGRFLMKAKTRERWRAIHLACHGLIHAMRPMRSALALAFDKVGSNLLAYDEVFHQRLSADLVVLSACNTGRGAIYRAEGIVGLTQAFMLAGSPRVICSLWKVDDEATQALMIKFYELWNPKEGEGLGAAEALQKSQEHIRVQERWKHPYFWAAWVLWGLPD